MSCFMMLVERALYDAGARHGLNDCNSNVAKYMKGMEEVIDFVLAPPIKQ